MRPQPLARLRDSAGMLRSHPVVGVGIGAALLLSLGAVCCGLGLLAAPWFACELMAWQLGTVLGRRVPRRWSWVGAGLLQGVAVVVVSAAAWLAMSWLGAETPVRPYAPDRLADDALGTLGFAVGGFAVAVVYLCPFVYAPLILLDRGGTLRGALLDSARIVGSGGLVAQMWFSFCSHVLQLLPLLVAAAVGMLVGDREMLPYAIVAAVPLLAATVPLGQGMLVSAYAERRDEVPRAHRLGEEASPPAPLATSLALLGVMPPIAILLVGGAVVTGPASPAPGTAPEGPVVAEATLGAPRTRRTLYLPDTSLRVRASKTGLSIEAADGGGAGRVSVPAEDPLQRVRIVRVRDAYAIEMTASGNRWVTWVDRTGVRLDDGLSSRLAERLPAPRPFVLTVAMVVSAIVFVRTLRPLAELRRTSALPHELRTVVVDRDDRRAAAVRKGWIRTVAFAPLAVAALVFAVLAL